MQSISPVTTGQLLAADQQPKVKVEIYVSAAWVNLCNLDSKNYVEDWSISLGGASMTPNPVGGDFSLTISNEDGIFHPDHPTSAYADYFKAGRKVRISIGAEYSSTDYYWQRIIGYMEEPGFDIDGAKVNISGSDYMKFLADTELKSPDNYWGSSQTFSSISSAGLIGTELYNEADAMDITGEANNVTNWSNYYCLFSSVADAGGGSTYVGKAIIDELPPTYPYIKNNNIFTPTDDTEYRFRFKYKIVTGTAKITVYVNQYTNGSYITLAEKDNLGEHSYTQEDIYFKTQGTGNIEIRIKFNSMVVDDEFRVDQFSMWEYKPYEDRYYELPAACKGAYRVILDGADVWQGEEDEGWSYEESTRRVFFDVNKTVATGTDNLVIYYFTTQPMEDVVADLLVTAGLYASQAAAKADMVYTDPAIDIDQVWFRAGTSALNAIKKICERCDYRFYFQYDGKPNFKPKPSGATVFTLTSQKHIASINKYQNKNEIKNRIVIEGKKRAEPVGRQETLPSEFTGEVSDATSITNYGERTLTIRNHLFQDQAAIDNMCASLLAEYKDPKWYVNFNAPFNPVPLEMGDKISWKERLSTSLEHAENGRIRDVKISKFNTTYKNETV